MRTVNFTKTLCGALALSCIVAGTACQQGARTSSNAKNATTTTIATPTTNAKAQAMRLERHVDRVTKRETLHHMRHIR
jgi:hypothetical protein